MFYRARKSRPPINTCQMRGGTRTLSPCPIDGPLCGSNLSAMAAKRGAEVPKVSCFTARANGDPPINTRQMRGSTPTSPPWPVDGALWDSNLSAMATRCGADVSKVACSTAHAHGAPPINTCQLRVGTPTCPPWPVDFALSDTNLSAMAAKCGAEVSKVTCFTVRANGAPP